MDYIFRRRLVDALAVIYVLGAIGTFGHAWNRLGDNNGWLETRIYGSLLCGGAWPLYVSAVVWEKHYANKS